MPTPQQIQIAREYNYHGWQIARFAQLIIDTVLKDRSISKRQDMETYPQNPIQGELF